MIYYILFSIALLERLKGDAEFCINGTKKIGCQIATKTATDKVNLLLNNAWKEFWINPEAFLAGGKMQLNNLMNPCNLNLYHMANTSNIEKIMEFFWSSSDDYWKTVDEVSDATKNRSEHY